MTFLAVNWLLALSLALGCAGGPDELEIGYGRLLAGDSTINEKHGAWGIDNEDSDLFTVGLVWKLRPTRVEVVNPVAPPVRWTLETETRTPDGLRTDSVAPTTTSSGADTMSATTSGSEGVDPPQDAEAAPEEEMPTPGEVSDALEAFNAFDVVTKIGFFVLAGLVLFAYRERLGRLIPGGGNGKKG